MFPYFRCALVVLSSLFTVGNGFAEDASDKEILDALLTDTGYDKRTRPETLTTITVSVLLHSLSSPDESSLNYEVEFLLFRTWRDERLQYDGNPKYLNGMSHAHLIWLPSTYIVKHGSPKQPMLDMSLRVYRNGTVIHIIRRGISINCQGNLKIFPFDNPKCPFAIESISLEEDELQLEWASETPLSSASSMQRFNAYLIDTNIGECGDMFTWRGKFSCLHVLLVFTRDKNYYLSSVFVPGMILVTSAFLSFWLDARVVPARVMLGVTTMLSFCTTTNTFRSSLPVVSNLTALNLWDGVCIFFIYTALLEFVLVNYLLRVEPQTNGESDETVSSRIAWIRGTKLSAKELSSKIENIAKIAFPSVFAVFVFIYFIVFAVVLPYNEDNWKIQPS